MRKHIYKTITGRSIDLGKLSTDEEKSFLHSVREKYDTAPEWSDFSAWWSEKFQRAGLSIESLVWRICQDLEARLGVEQGMVAKPSYRDYLADLIEEKYGTRYKFCKNTGIDQGHLSRVLFGKSELSLESLSKILEALDMDIYFQDKKESRVRSSSQRASKALAGI